VSGRLESGPDLEIERLLSRQSRGVGAKPILELNMRHALIKAIGGAQNAKHEADVNDLSALRSAAQILDGEVPDDPAAFAARLKPAGGAGIRSDVLGAVDNYLVQMTAATSWSIER